MNEPDAPPSWPPPGPPPGPQEETSAYRKGQKLVYGDFAAARRHSTFVRWLRRIFIIVPILTGVAMTIHLAFDPFRRLPGNISIGKVDIEGTKVTVEMPNVSGLQSNGRPFAVRAEQAHQDIAKPNIVSMAKVVSDIGMADGSSAHITADDGVYDSNLDRIRLTGDVRIKNHGHYDMTLPSLDIGLKAGRLQAFEGAEVVIDAGVIGAETMLIEDQGHHIQFEGNVTSQFKSADATAPEGAGDQP